MKKFELFNLLMVLCLGLVITSCHDDDHDHDDDNKIAINIKEPTSGETITDCKEVHVHIEITATDSNHDVEILLHPEGKKDDKIIDVDMHKHDKVIKFDQEVNLCNYDPGTCFHLEVAACVDHDCKKKETKDVEFCLKK